MRSRSLPLLLTILALGLSAAGSLLGSDSPPPGTSAAPVEDLRPGEPRSLELDPDAIEWPSFRVLVPARATALRLWTTDATHDVELFVSFAEAPDPYYEDYALVGDNAWLDEELLIDVTDMYSLESGSWYVCVAPALNQPPIENGPVRVSLHAELIVPEPQPLVLGEPVEITLQRDQGLRQAFSIEVPDDLGPEQRLRFEAFSALGDIDLLAGPKARSHTFLAPYRSSETSLPYERFELRKDAIVRGLTVHVFAYPELEYVDEIPVRILVTRAEDPLRLCPEPSLPIPVADDLLGRAKAATVAIWGPLGAGSGAVLTPDGLVLTNAHVVTGIDEQRGLERGVPELVVGFNRDPRQPVIPRFGASLLRYDQELDLALLQIDSDLLFAPLPEDARFPSFDLADVAEMNQGDDLYTLGFPMTGGSSAMVTLTLSRGVHCGWAPENYGLTIKTDAAVHSGVSGGACVDGQGRFVGTPSSSIADVNEAGGLGFVIPVEHVPADWL